MRATSWRRSVAGPRPAWFTTPRPTLGRRHLQYDASMADAHAPTVAKKRILLHGACGSGGSRRAVAGRAESTRLNGPSEFDVQIYFFAEQTLVLTGYTTSDRALTYPDASQANRWRNDFACIFAGSRRSCLGALEFLSRRPGINRLPLEGGGAAASDCGATGACHVRRRFRALTDRAYSNYTTGCSVEQLPRKCRIATFPSADAAR